jgi:uncharacterized LabA/DUF88 family protein
VGFLLVARGKRRYRPSLKRAAFYVDGFNLYHSIDGLGDPKLKWLSLTTLAQMLIPKRDEAIESITYFSALATRRGHASVGRHRTYISALKAQGVECVLGRFKDRPRRCFACGNQWMHPEEKETDVNIAIRMVSDAYEDRYDVCYLISADTDLVPPLRLIRENLLEKEVVAVSPPNRPHGQHIRSLAHRCLKLNRDQIERCRLPNTLSYQGQPIVCPSDYS